MPLWKVTSLEKKGNKRGVKKPESGKSQTQYDTISKSLPLIISPNVS